MAGIQLCQLICDTAKSSLNSSQMYLFISITSWHFLNYSPITCVCDPRGHVYNCFPTDTKVHEIQIPFSYSALCCQKHYLLQNIASRHQQWYRWKISKLWFPGQNGKLSSTRKWRRKLHWREDGWSLIDSIFLLKGKVIELTIFPTHFQYQKETLFSTNKDLFLLKISWNNIFGLLQAISLSMMRKIYIILRWKRWGPADGDSSSHHCSCGCCCAFSQVSSIFSQPLSDSFGVDTAWTICRQHKEDVKLPISTSKQSSYSKWRAKEAWLLKNCLKQIERSLQTPEKKSQG